MACDSAPRCEPGRDGLDLRKGWRGVLALSVALLAGGSCCASGEPQALRLELHPFADQAATFVRLAASGEARVVRYSANALVVFAVHAGRLPEGDTRRLLASAGQVARGWARSGRDRSQASSGLEHGDLFSLKVSGAGATQRIGGFLHLADAETVALIGELAVLESRLQEVAGAEAFLRVERLAPQQAAALDRRGLVHPVAIGELPATLRPLIEEALSETDAFQPVDAATYRQIVALANHGKELLIDVSGTVFKLGPFEARNVSVLSPF